MIAHRTQRAIRGLKGQEGFALVIAIMMLFVAMILGLMVVDSADMEIMLSGAQQRYEDSLNTAEGGAGIEAVALGTNATLGRVANPRSYGLVDLDDEGKVLSPDTSNEVRFDPGEDMADPAAVYTVNENTLPDKWPTDNLLQSDTPANDRFDYQYRVIYLRRDSPPEGNAAEELGGYLFEIAAQRDTLVEMGGNMVGRKD